MQLTSLPAVKGLYSYYGYALLHLLAVDGHHQHSMLGVAL